MAEYKTKQQINLTWGQTFKMSVKAPAVAKRIFNTYSDALEYANNYSDTAVAGLILAVINDSESSKNGAYFVAKASSGANKNDASLEKIGSSSESTGSTTANTYYEAIDLANADNIGQIIYVTNNSYEYTSTKNITSGETYYVYNEGSYDEATEDDLLNSGITKYTKTTSATDGAYIVTGVNSVSKLSESTPSGDVTQDVVTLQKDVASLKSEVEKLYFECSDEEDLGLTE